MAADIKQIVDDKSKYTDWATRSDIKSEFEMDLILILAKYDYPPSIPRDGVYKEVFEQAENFNPNRSLDDLQQKAEVFSPI